MSRETLTRFVQDQFRRVDRWCWETIVEEVSIHAKIPLNADNTTYAAGSLRTGPFRFERNNQAWRSLCDRIVQDDEAASSVVNEVVKALTSTNARGVSAAWRGVIQPAIDASPSQYHFIIQSILTWNELVYTTERSFSPELSSETSIVYGLWRLTDDGKPLMLSPSYIGEAAGNMLSRLIRPKNKCHRDWWGDGKPIGVTLATVDPDQRKQVEAHLISVLTPFCNVSKNQLAPRWPFQQP